MSFQIKRGNLDGSDQSSYVGISQRWSGAVINRQEDMIKEEEIHSLETKQASNSVGTRRGLS